MTKGDQIKKLLLKGKNYGEISREVGCASSTIAYHAKKLKLNRYTFERKTYNWKTVQAYYDDGHTIQEALDYFGMDRSSWHEARNRGDVITVDTPERKAKLKYRRMNGLSKGINGALSEEIFKENSLHTTQTAKNRILRNELIPYSCDNKKCFLHGKINPSWAGDGIVLHLDHKNGISNDHRLDNLRFLCPNCHSQTETYAGRNNKIMSQ